MHERLHQAGESPIQKLLDQYGAALGGWLLLAIVPCVLWLLVVWLGRHQSSSVLASGLIGVLLLGAVFFIDFWASFGESFVEGVDKNRLPVWIALTVVTTFAFMIISLRKPQREEQGVADQRTARRE